MKKYTDYIFRNCYKGVLEFEKSKLKVSRKYFNSSLYNVIVNNFDCIIMGITIYLAINLVIVFFFVVIMIILVTVFFRGSIKKERKYFLELCSEIMGLIDK